jgi:hypothetical protein
VARVDSKKTIAFVRNVPLTMINCSSAKVSNKDLGPVWEDAVSFRFNATPYESNMEAERVRLETISQLPVALAKKRREEIDGLYDKFFDNFRRYHDVKLPASIPLTDSAAEIEVPAGILKFFGDDDT